MESMKRTSEVNRGKIVYSAWFRAVQKVKFARYKQVKLKMNVDVILQFKRMIWLSSKNVRPKIAKKMIDEFVTI